MTARKEDLLRLPLFSSLTDDELTEFSARVEIRQFSTNQTIYRAGDAGGLIYVVLNGKVRIFVVGGYGRQIIVAQAEMDDSFGEIPDSGSGVCSATAVALIDTRLIILDRQSLSYLLSVKPDAALTLIAALETRLRHLQQILAKSKARPNR